MRRGLETMLDVRVTENEIHFGESVTVGFERTLRIPENGRTYGLPPGLDVCPLYRVEDYAERLPVSWRRRGGAFLHLYQREAMWISFSGLWWKPNAVKVAVGTINAVTGEPGKRGLSHDPQDYLVVPEQPWLGGIADGDDYVRQFVAPPLGPGRALAEPMATEVESAGIRITVFEPRAGRFPDVPPDTTWRPKQDAPCFMACRPHTPPEMSRPANAPVSQRVRPDEHGLDAWDADNCACVTVYIVNTVMFREITGAQPPPTPISPRHYTQYRLPWLDHYDEDPGDMPANGRR